MHFNWFKGYIYMYMWEHKEKNFKDATLLTIVIFFRFKMIYE